MAIVAVNKYLHFTGTVSGNFSPRGFLHQKMPPVSLISYLPMSGRNKSNMLISESVQNLNL
jgi:hypothetical protein